jgi:GH25 family lysozyme M1 (1,4-beta-N-acetylmuramidase)
MDDQLDAQVHRAQGEDRSSYQQIGPWSASSFGFAKATEGTGWTDPTFAANWAALKAAGKPRGAYHFFHPELNAVAQANFFLSVVDAHGLGQGDMLVIDCEVFPGPGGVLDPGPTDNFMARPAVPFAGALSSAEAVGSGTHAFLAALHEGAQPHHPRIVYTTLSGLAYLDSCSHYQLWIAHPASAAPTDVSPWTSWRFWQWQFGGGPGGGDCDAFNGTETDLRNWLDTYGNTPG